MTSEDVSPIVTITLLPPVKKIEFTLNSMIIDKILIRLRSDNFFRFLFFFHSSRQNQVSF